MAGVLRLLVFSTLRRAADPLRPCDVQLERHSAAASSAVWEPGPRGPTSRTIASNGQRSAGTPDRQRPARRPCDPASCAASRSRRRARRGAPLRAPHSATRSCSSRSKSPSRRLCQRAHVGAQLAQRVRVRAGDLAVQRRVDRSARSSGSAVCSAPGNLMTFMRPPRRPRGALAQARQRAVQPRARIALADAERLRELGVESWPWNFSSTISRSRAGSAASALAHALAALESPRRRPPRPVIAASVSAAGEGERLAAPCGAAHRAPHCARS